MTAEQGESIQRTTLDAIELIEASNSNKFLVEQYKHRIEEEKLGKIIRIVDRVYNDTKSGEEYENRDGLRCLKTPDLFLYSMPFNDNTDNVCRTGLIIERSQDLSAKDNDSFRLYLTKSVQRLAEPARLFMGKLAPEGFYLPHKTEHVSFNSPDFRVLEAIADILDENYPQQDTPSPVPVTAPEQGVSLTRNW